MFRSSGLLFRQIGLCAAAILVFLWAPSPGTAQSNEAPQSAQATSFDPAPWLADLDQARDAFRSKYANLSWLENEREVQLDPLFGDLASRMGRARSEQDARAVFDRLVTKTGDGHVEIEWPQAPAPSSSGAAAAPVDPCAGYDARQNGPGTAFAMPGYVPLRRDPANPFRAGTVDLVRTRLGIVRIGVFQPQGFPQLCKSVVAEHDVLAKNRGCGDQCPDEITDILYERLTAALEERARELGQAGARVLLVDVTGNGGGSEWAEAAARIFSRKALISERRGMVRGEHWANEWRELANRLRQLAAGATGDDKRRLFGWAAEAETRLREAQAPCATDGACRRIADAGFATGLVGSAKARELDGKPWGSLIFSPAQYPYHDAVWRGPLIVLVDNETWSAAEEFAAVLQDNRAAVIVGARTGGAGCGHTSGGDPIKLANSGATLLLPDCVRFRADGSNEVRGVLPDVPVPVRASDGAHFKGRVIEHYLPLAIRLARRMSQTP